MHHPPLGVPHPPGVYHPFDPVSCLSDAMWQQQRNAEAAAFYDARMRETAQAEAQIAARRTQQAAVELLLLLR